MKKNTFVPISVLLGALLLALVATMTPFLAEPDLAHAQETLQNDASLSNLTLSVGELTQVGGNGDTIGFSAIVYDYTADVPHRNTTIRVTATPNIQGSQVKINYGGSVTQGTSGSITGGTDVSPGASIPLAVGTTPIGILVTALDGTTAYAYQVTVNRISASASSDAKLDGLSINAGALSPAFKKNVKSYTALVPNSRGVVGSTFEVTPTIPAGANSEFVITSDKASDITTATSGQATTVPLSVGANVITIKVTAENLVATETYRLTMTRAAANASDDARLSALRVGGLTLAPAFKSNVMAYTAGARYSITQTIVSFGKNHSGALAVVMPADFNPGTAAHEVFLGVGDTVITIEVTAEDATTMEMYTLTVKRAGVNASSDAKLDGLSINAGTETPAFNENVKNYTALVPNSRGVVDSTFEVTPTSPDGATFVITSDKASDITTATSGQATTVPLSVGANVITIKVTAENLVATETYTLTVTRAAANASDDARLSALMVGGQSVSVSGFVSNAIADYTTGVPNGVNSITIDATPNHSGAIVVIKSGAALGTEASGTVDADGTVDLNVTDPGEPSTINTIGIEVTAEDGNTVGYYYLQITRAAASASSDAKLDGLSINAGTETPAFNENVKNYTALVPNSRGVVGSTFEVTPTSPDGATFVITSDKASDIDTQESTSPTTVPLSVGANVITIKVTAENLVATETYTLTVTRAAANASNDARLSALMVGGQSVSVSGFVSNAIADYTTGVPNGVNSITIDATPNHSGAIVVIKSGAALGTVASGTVDADGTVDLNVTATAEDPNTIGIEVTAEDGETVGYYYLQITRAAASASSDAKLDGLTLTSVTISPVFGENTKMYNAEVPLNIASTTVMATAAGTATSVVISSDKDDDIGPNVDSDGVANTSNVGRHTIDLSTGANVITITVTAADYETMETYTVRVTRGTSNDATLSSLSLMDGDGMAIALMDMDGMTAEFMADTMMYYADVDAGVEMINVMATAMSSDATVSGDGAVSLDVGENTITVTVTAADGTTTMTYTVTVTVAPPVDGDLLDMYDADNDNQISKDEAIAAINDYLFGEGDQQITKAEVIEVINLYLFG